MKVFAKSRDNKVIHFGIVAKYFLFERPTSFLVLWWWTSCIFGVFVPFSGLGSLGLDKKISQSNSIRFFIGFFESL